MQRPGTMVADPIAEARDKFDIVSALEEARGRANPSREMVLDVLSLVLAGARGGEKMSQQYSQQTGNPAFKQRWQKLSEQAQDHARIIESTIRALGGDPVRKSPPAQDLDRVVGCMLQVEAPGEAGDLVRLGNLAMLAHLCQRQCRGLGNVARQIRDPGMAKLLWDASDILEREEAAHVIWSSVTYDDQFMKVMAGV